MMCDPPLSVHAGKGGSNHRQHNPLHINVLIMGVKPVYHLPGTLVLLYYHYRNSEFILLYHH